MDRIMLEKAWLDSFDFPIDDVEKKQQLLAGRPTARLAREVYNAAMQLRDEGINWYGSAFEEELLVIGRKGDAVIENPDKHISVEEYKEILKTMKNLEENGLESTLTEKEKEELVNSESIDLPATITIPVNELALDTDDIYKDEAGLGDIVSDYLSDKYGFCHFGFALEVVFNEFNEPSDVIVTDIKWDIDEIDKLTDDVRYDLYEFVGLTSEEMRNIYRGVTGLENDGEFTDKEIHEYLLDAMKEKDDKDVDEIVRNAENRAQELVMGGADNKNKNSDMIL